MGIIPVTAIKGGREITVLQISMNVKLILTRVLQMESVLTPMGISPVNATMDGQVLTV